jgi:hypothetical protein
MSDLSTSSSRIGRFDTVLLVVLVILGVFVGIAAWYTGYAGMFLLPIAAVLLSLVGAAIARHRRYLVAFCSATALNVPWLVVVASRGLLTDPGELPGLLQLVGFAWGLPVGIVFYILWATKD